MRTISEQKAKEEQANIDRYLDTYDLFIASCNNRKPDLSSMEISILHLGYVARVRRTI